jgi:hypothetical protein
LLWYLCAWSGAFDWPKAEFLLVYLWGVSRSRASLIKDLTEKLQKQKVIAHFYVKIYLQLAQGTDVRPVAWPA